MKGETDKMLKGVNRQVVEVSRTDSVYFEKILFFVKPEFYGLGEGKLREKADAALQNSPVPARSRAQKKGRAVLRYLAAAAGGAVFSAGIGALVQLAL